MATATDPELRAPFRWDGGHVAVDLPGARGLFTTRRGGVSGGPYASLNFGRLTEDDPAAVDENRRRLGERIGAGWGDVLFGRQVHGAAVRRNTEPRGERPVADEDGQATALTGAPALVFTADCLPVLLAAEGAVAAVHAGWRGLAAGVIAEGVAALRDVGARGPVRAALGPRAAACCYEVGEEVQKAFAGVPGARSGERNLDLGAIARARLADAGVEDVHDAGLCTMCRPDLFFSHRRDAGVTGRQAGVAWRA